MNHRVLKRFITIALAATLLGFAIWSVLASFVGRPAGDYETEQGSNQLGGGRHQEALRWFDQALAVSPNHRGAMMGRAIVFLETGDYQAAEREFSRLIDHLRANLAPDDLTGRGTLAGGYANRGILYDRTGRYEQALADYQSALAIDSEAVKGPGIVHKVLYGNARPGTVADRARYLAAQLALPAEQRVFSRPEADARQRMHKP